MLKKLLVAVLCLLPIGLIAQDLKFGHVNSQEVLMNLPQMKDIQAKLEKMAKDYETELTAKSEEYEKKMKEFLDPKNENIDPLLKQSRQKDLIDLEAKIDNIKQAAQEQLQREQAKQIEPIITMAKDEINAIGKEKGFIYIFDISAGGAVVYASDKSEDITPLLKQRLEGKTPPKPTTTTKPATGTRK